MAASDPQVQEHKNEEPWFLKSSFPVFLPTDAALTANQSDFEAYLRSVKPSLSNVNDDAEKQNSCTDVEDKGTESILDSAISTAADVREDLGKMQLDAETSSKFPLTSKHPFMQGLLSQQLNDLPEEWKSKQTEGHANLMRTENRDIAYRSTTDALLDLFTELEDVVSGPRLRKLLEGAWKADADMTLKIAFNARSIHLGKASRQTFYRCAGWLAKNHPQTLLKNLAWLSRPVIQKKVEKEGGEEGEEKFEIISAEEAMDENDAARFDIKNGVAHGYWKDLLNLLALHVNGKLDVLANPRDVLNIEQEKDSEKCPNAVSREEAKILRRDKRDARHATAVKLFHEDPVYRALHLTVARLFADQLKRDLALLNSDDKNARRRISLCAKWAPSSERFHDKHTFVVSSIAELLHPVSEFGDLTDEGEEHRQLYLRHAREAYRKDVSALRKHLEVVERDITAKTYKNIKYDRVPSIAMSKYSSLFATNDMDRFERYADDVADGKARISGATLFPSTLIKAVRKINRQSRVPSASDDDDDKAATAGDKRKSKSAKYLIQRKVEDMKVKVLEGQWNALVQRIKDSGTLSNAIAVADVSGSMDGPVFPDGTCPMDSSIALSMLIAEVTQPPFGGAFITFEDHPRVHRVDGPECKTLRDKVKAMERSPWGTSTNFVAVFEELILPMAIENKLKQEDMVKRIFVFSDMQFNAAEGGWRTMGRDAKLDKSSYERIKAKYREAGYEMPELVFWNLAGGRTVNGDPVAPKPVTAEEEGTALVSGYSQGMLKVFLDGGSFEDAVEEEEVVDVAGEDGEVVVDMVKKRQKLDPLSVVRKAVGHRAYEMLRVVD